MPREGRLNEIGPFILEEEKQAFEGYDRNHGWY